MNKYYTDVLTKVKRDEYDIELIKLIYRAYYYAGVIAYCVVDWEHNSPHISPWFKSNAEYARRLKPSEHICNLQMRNKKSKGGYYCLDRSGETIIRFIDNVQGEFSLSNFRYHFNISPHGFHDSKGTIYQYAGFDITIKPGSHGTIVSFFSYTRQDYSDVVKPGSMLWLYIYLLKQVCDKIRANVKMAMPVAECKMVLPYKQ